MPQLFNLSIKPGVGPVLKIMSDAADDPHTTPNDEYFKFRFNSETSEIGYVYDHSDLTWNIGANHVAMTAASQFALFLPPGSDENNAQIYVGLIGVTATPYFYQGFVPCLGRLTDLPYKAYWIQLVDATNYVKAWEIEGLHYPSSSNWRRWAWNLRHVRTSDSSPLNMNWSGFYRIANVVAPQLLCQMSQTSVLMDHPWYNPTFDGAGTRFLYEPPTYPADQTYRYVCLELPIDSTAWPPVAPDDPEPNQVVFENTPTWVGMAKPGFEASPTQEYNKMIFSSEKIPFKLVRSGSFTLAAGAEIEISVDFPITVWSLVDHQVSITGEPIVIPPAPTSDSTLIDLRYKIDEGANSVFFKNFGVDSLDVRYFVMTEQAIPIGGGDGESIVATEEYSQIRNPITGEVIVDSRTFYLPIIAQGWVTPGEMIVSDITAYGNVMHTVDIDNTGFKLYVLAVGTYDYDLSDGEGRVYIPLFAKKVEGQPRYARTTLMATINSTHSQVKFYAYDGGLPARLEDDGNQDWGSVTTFIGFRYYIFAVPDSI